MYRVITEHTEAFLVTYGVVLLLVSHFLAFDTPLTLEGIVGRIGGAALHGLLLAPVGLIIAGPLVQACCSLRKEWRGKDN